jgi:glycosyltransferase involved in cell wall biosynthesis
MFDTGGSEKVVVDIYRALDPGRFESHICTFFPGEYDRSISTNPNQRHILVRETAASALPPVTKLVNMLKRLSRLNQIMRHNRIDLVHTHHLGPLLHFHVLHKITRRRTPWVHTEHNVPDLEEGYAHLSFRWTRPLREPDFVTGVSPSVCQFLSQKCAVVAERIKLIPNGVDIDRFGLHEDQNAVRTELGLLPEDEIIGCIGNLRKEKNQRLAIEALAMLCQQRPRLKLVICGDGDHRSELENLARSLNVSQSTLFLGYRLDAPRVFAALDLFCLPSSYEGMPLSILEAWAAGKPVVATDVIGIRDLVSNGVNGLLVPADVPRAMADALRALLDDPSLRLRLTGNGRRVVAEKYSLQAMVDKYAGLYERLAAG